MSATRTAPVEHGRPSRLTGWTTPTLIVAVAIGVLSVGPFMARGTIEFCFNILILITAAQIWNVLAGMGGQIVLGVGAFAGTGTYAALLAMIHLGADWILAVAAAGVAAAALAALAAFPLFRLRDAYFSIGTLVLALAMSEWVQNWEFAGANQGLGIPISSVPDSRSLFSAALIVAAAVTLAAALLPRTGVGLSLQAIRDDIDAADATGVSVRRLNILLFVAGGFAFGVVGALAGIHQVNVVPSSAFSLDWTIDALLMTVIGGLRSPLGPVIGAVVAYGLIERPLAALPSVGTLLTGVIVIALMLFAPGGLLGLADSGFRRAVRSLQERRRGSSPA